MKNVICTLLLVATGQLFSQSTWDGSSSTNWNTNANWTPSGVPAAGSSVIINAALPNQPVLSGNVTITNLTISAGTLNLNGYTLTLSGSPSFTGGTVQNGSIVANSPITQMQSTIFNGPLTITKNGNGGGGMNFNGGNTFNGAVTIVNNGNNVMQMATTTADIFNGDMTFRQLNAAGNLYPASTGTNNFKGNISTSGTVKQVVFGYNGGTVVINGDKSQFIQGAAAQAPLFNKLQMNTTGNLTLQVPAITGTSLTLTNGILYSTATNLMTLNDNVTISGASNASFVYGPVRKIGNDAFTFPTGRAGVYAPISISAPLLTSDHFTAEYFNIPTPHNLTLLDLGLNHVSKEEYWALNRTGGISTVVVTLSYSAADRSGTISNLSHLRVSGWNGLLNLDLLNGGTTGDFNSGTVSSFAPALLYGDFTLASSSAANPMKLTLPPTTMVFVSPTTSDNITWKFLNVRPGLDALVTIISTKNASLVSIDDSSSYKNSWQPSIFYPSATNNASDSSYIQFRVTFERNGIPEAQESIAMTVVDEDGSGIGGPYRELVKISQPAVPKGIAGTGITISENNTWLTLIGAEPNILSIDTANTVAMMQVDLSNVSSYVMRVGVVGKVPANTVRQNSFAFQNFTSMNVVLPVKLLNFNAQYAGNDAKVSWVTSEEENMKSFEVYRSLDGINYIKLGEVEAKGYSQMASAYTLMDVQIALQANENVFYKLKMNDLNGQYTWSTVVVLKKTNKVAAVGTVYPNPTKGELNLNIENPDSEFNVDVVDMFGKVLQAYSYNDMNSNSTLDLDVTGLSNGVYFIRVTSLDGNSSLTKFIKN